MSTARARRVPGQSSTQHDRSELDELFGPLEAEIMEIVWRMGSATPSEVRDALAPERDLAYTTVMTVLSRLHGKDVLSRRKSGRAYAYSPRQSKTELLGAHVSRAMQALSGAGAGPALSYFVDAAASLDDDQLAALEREITRLRKTRG